MAVGSENSNNPKIIVLEGALGAVVDDQNLCAPHSDFFRMWGEYYRALDFF